MLTALFDKGRNALLPRLFPDFEEMRHAHAHQPDLDGQLCLQQSKGNCLYLCCCADVLWQAVGSCSHLKGCCLQLYGQGLALQTLSSHVSRQMLSNFNTLQ